MIPGSYERILVPLDGSEVARRALGPAQRLAHLFDAELWLVGVVTPDGDPDELTAALADGTEGGHAPVLTTVVESDSPGRELARMDVEHPEALVCMSTRGRHPLAAALLGRTSREVVERSTQAVVLVGPSCEVDLEIPLARLLVAVDGTPEGEEVLEWVRVWVTTTGLAVSLLHVVYPLVDPQARVALSDEQQRELAYVHRLGHRWQSELAAPVTALGLRAADPVDALREHTADVVGALVMVAARRGGLVGEAVIGSTSRRLIRVSPDPVVVVSRPDRRRL